MIAEAHAGENAVRMRLDEPTGMVRVSLPVAIADIALARLLPRFMLKYPKVRLTVQASNRRVDLLEENIDVVQRGVGVQLESSSLVQVSLCSVRWALVVSPIYLAQSGPIDNLETLARTNTLCYGPINENEVVWRLMGSDDTHHKIAIGKLRLHTDNLSILKEATLAGIGVSSLPLYACAAELAAGTLKIVLPEWRPKA